MLRHRGLTIKGPAGGLEALLWVPGEVSPPLAAVICHPHPLHGGTMHNKVVYHAAQTLHRFGLPVLRFNFRGVGLSEGAYDGGRGEAEDVRAALDLLDAEFPRTPLLVAGFSFGAAVGLPTGCSDPRVHELIGLGLPVNNFDVSYLRTCAKPKLLIQRAKDHFGSQQKWEELAAGLPPDVAAETQIVFVPDADHFFTHRLEPMVQALSEWLVHRHPQLREAQP
jgi:hypothetical protein